MRSRLLRQSPENNASSGIFEPMRSLGGGGSERATEDARSPDTRDRVRRPPGPTPWPGGSAMGLAANGLQRPRHVQCLQALRLPQAHVTVDVGASFPPLHSPSENTGLRLQNRELASLGEEWRGPGGDSLSRAAGRPGRGGPLAAGEPAAQASWGPGSGGGGGSRVLGQSGRRRPWRQMESDPRCSPSP